MEKLGTVLAELAQKLNTTADKLWNVLVLQAHTYAMFNIILGGMLVVATIVYVVVSLRLIKVKDRSFSNWDRYKYEEKSATSRRNWFDHQYTDLNNEGVAGVCAVADVLLGIILLIMNICFWSCSLYGVVTALTNPEYWALQQIMGKIAQ